MPLTKKLDDIPMLLIRANCEDSNQSVLDCKPSSQATPGVIEDCLRLVLTADCTGDTEESPGLMTRECLIWRKIMAVKTSDIRQNTCGLYRHQGLAQWSWWHWCHQGRSPESTHPQHSEQVSCASGPVVSFTCIVISDCSLFNTFLVLILKVAEHWGRTKNHIGNFFSKSQ